MRSGRWSMHSAWRSVRSYRYVRTSNLISRTRSATCRAETSRPLLLCFRALRGVCFASPVMRHQLSSICNACSKWLRFVIFGVPSILGADTAAVIA
jgi:hypothetical protein